MKRVLLSMIMVIILVDQMQCSGSTNKLQSKVMSRLRSRTKNKHHLTSKSRSKEEIQLSIEDLQYLTDSSKHKINQNKKRFTKDGRACASSFAFNGQVFHDCTDGSSPDNKNSGEEWCYVDANAGGSPNWGYCKPILDYDAVRKKTQGQYTKMTVEARKVDHLVEEQIMPTSKLNQMVSYVKEKQQAVDFKINTISNQINKVDDNYNVLTKLKGQFDDLEAEIQVLKAEVEALVAKKEAEGGKDPNNCEGMLGYENEGPGDGLTGLYFDNEDFMGEPASEKIDNQVDFSWENEEPAPGINQDNFSIKWQSWLRVPVDGKYNFYTESDDGNQLIFNGKPILKHFWSQTGKEGGNWLDSHIGNLRKNIKPGQVESNAEAGLITAQSYPIDLIGGQKYRIEYHMYHSVHNEEQDSGQAFAKLYWENEFMEKQIIIQDFLYTQNKVPPIKIFNYDPKVAQITEMKENDNAFLFNDVFKIQDIPFQFQGAPGLKLVKDWPNENFKFSVNGPILLYLVVLGSQNPLPDDFKFTQDVMSILEVNPKDKPQNGRIKAKKSVAYFIYKKKFSAGDHVIQLAQLKETKNHLLLFYTPDPNGGSALSCGGEEVSVSSPKNPDYKGCKESSRLNKNGYSCDQGFSGKMEDTESGIWATEQSGVGSFIELILKNPYQISKVQIKDRNNAIERNQKIEIKFDNGDVRNIQLKNLDSIQTFKIDPPVVSKSIRFTIKQVYSTGNNGGAFNVFGTPCVDPKKLENPENTEKQEVKELTASCEDTILENKFQAVGLKPDTELLITCPESCSTKDGNIFGDLEYSEDSVICKTAFHAGALGEKGGKFKIKLMPGKFEYSGSFRSGVQSKSKQGNSLLTLSFGKDSSSKDIMDILKQGMKLDIFDSTMKNWLPGQIASVERVDAQSAKLVVTKDNMPESSKESLTWPNPEKLDFCGLKVEKRVCDKDSMPPTAAGDGANVKVAFGLMGAPAGYILDSGDKYKEQNGYTYGWTVDNSKNIRKRAEGEGVQNQIVLFSPDSKSSYCTAENPKQSCADNIWMIKMSKGTYNVKLVMGDKKYQSQYDLAVNDVRFVSGKILKKDQFLTEQQQIKVQANNPYIKISTKCLAENCEYSWSRISAIEIESVAEEEKKDNKVETVQSGCGEAFEAGKCNEDGQDVENCLYKKDDKFQTLCTGTYMLIDVDKAYFCKDQIGKLKCIKLKFKDQQECEKKCPGKCKGVKCEAKP